MGQGSPELLSYYGVQTAIRSRRIGNVRAWTQYKSNQVWPVNIIPASVTCSSAIAWQMIRFPLWNCIAVPNEPPSLPARIPLSKLRYLFTSQYSSYTTAQLLWQFTIKALCSHKTPGTDWPVVVCHIPGEQSILVREIFVVDKVALQLTFLQAIWFS